MLEVLNELDEEVATAGNRLYLEKRYDAVCENK